MEFLTTFFPLIIMFVLMYFMLIRPQKKQMAAKKEMLSKLQKGQQIITIGGLHGMVEEVDQPAGTVVIDCEGIYLTFELSAIATVKPTPTGSHVGANQEELSEEAALSLDSEARKMDAKVQEESEDRSDSQD